MTDIETTISQNAAGLGQLEDAAQKLEDLGDSLLALVQRYKV